MNQHQDIRAVKTIEATYNAFLDLVDKKSFQKISVKMICQEARISRSTFYDHFKDKYDLVNCLLRDMSRTVAADLIFFSEENPRNSPIFSLKDKYKKLLVNILHDTENRELFDIFRKVIAKDICGKMCKQHGDDVVEAPWINVTAEFYSGAIISVLSLWLDPKQNVPAEELVSYINVLLEPMDKQIEKLQQTEKNLNSA